MIEVPKKFLTSICVPYGPWEGQLADPRLCGHPTSLEDDQTLHLIQWKDGSLMFCHEGCIPDNVT